MDKVQKTKIMPVNHTSPSQAYRFETIRGIFAKPDTEMTFTFEYAAVRCACLFTDNGNAVIRRVSIHLLRVFKSTSFRLHCRCNRLRTKPKNCDDVVTISVAFNDFTVTLSNTAAYAHVQ